MIFYTRIRREETYLQVLAPQGLFLDCSDLLHTHAFPPSVVLQVPVVLSLLANKQQLGAEFQRVIRAFEPRISRRKLPSSQQERVSHSHTDLQLKFFFIMK